MIDLIFDPTSHTSRTSDGRDVPHVTTVLSATGVGTDFDGMAASISRFAEVLDNARHRGIAVHSDCHAYDDDDLDWASVDPRIEPFVKVWAQCRKAKHLRPLTRERQVFHSVFWYTGIIDGIFTCDVNHKIILVDLKTGNPDDARADLQTAAYEAAWNYAHPEQRIHERWAIWLHPDLRRGYTVINYTSRPDAPTHFGTFLACLTVYREQQRRSR